MFSLVARGELDRLEGPGYAARRTELRRKAKEAASENKGPAGGGVAGRGRRERRDRGGSDKGENDESGTAARWHEGCSEKRRETAKRDTKRQTPQGGRRLAHHTPLLKIPVWWRRAVLPSLPWVVCFLSFFLSERRYISVTPLAGTRAAFVKLKPHSTQHRAVFA